MVRVLVYTVYMASSQPAKLKDSAPQPESLSVVERVREATGSPAQVLVDENGAAIQPPRDAERKSGIKIKRPGLVPKCYCGRKAAKLCGRWVCSPRQGSMCSLGRE